MRTPGDDAGPVRLTKFFLEVRDFAKEKTGLSDQNGYLRHLGECRACEINPYLARSYVYLPTRMKSAGREAQTQTREVTTYNGCQNR